MFDFGTKISDLISRVASPPAQGPLSLLGPEGLPFEVDSKARTREESGGVTLIWLNWGLDRSDMNSNFYLENHVTRLVIS